jgi:hypothetical protein
VVDDEIKLPDEEPVETPVLESVDEKDVLVSVSLKYWHSGTQCFSDWQSKELKRLTRFIDRAQSLTASQIKTDPGLIWKTHRGPAARGFSRPSSLSEDIPLTELRVSDKARVHGAMIDQTFFLVWLDRNHQCFPSGK